MPKSQKQCLNCKAAGRCRDTAVSWIFLFIGVIATISVRVVNLVLSFGLFWPKFFWYLGVAGFFLYFLYLNRALLRPFLNVKTNSIFKTIYLAHNPCLRITIRSGYGRFGTAYIHG